MAKANDVVNQIKKATRRKFSVDEKIRIVLEGLRGEISISELCRQVGITLYRIRLWCSRSCNVHMYVYCVYVSWSKSVNHSCMLHIFTMAYPAEQGERVEWRFMQ
jgi:hypothetical protein